MSPQSKKPEGQAETSETTPEASPRKTKRDSTPQISIETYNAMYDAWCTRQTIRHVAKVCRVNQVTATKYVEKGDPSRHLRPLRERWEQVQRNAELAEDYSLVKARREVQTTARALLTKIAQRLQGLDASTLDGDGLARMLEVTQRVLERTLGVADATVEVRGPDKWAGWSVEEMLTYAQTGEMPAHARGRSPAVRAHEADQGG
jgi:hypothetical protein